MRVQKLTTRLHRGLSIVLALLMVLALIPFGAFADEGNWGDAFQQDKIDKLQGEVLAYANQALEDMDDEGQLAFTFTGYTLPEDTVIGEDKVTPKELPAAYLSVTVGMVPNSKAYEISLPAGTYDVAFSDQSIQDAKGIADGGSLTISVNNDTEVSYTLTGQTPDPAKPDLNEYITGMTLSVNDGDPVDLTENHGLTLKVGDKIAVTGTFSIQEPFKDAGFRNETPYSIDLPQALSYAHDAKTEVIDEDDVTAGVFSLSAQNKTATFTFDKNYLDENVGKMSGEFSYTGSVQPGPDGSSDKVSFTVAGNIILIPIIQEVPKATVAKSGQVLANTDSALTRWTINVQSPAKVFPQRLTVTDKMSLPANTGPIHQLREVESVKIDSETVPSDGYTVDATSKDGFTLTLNQEYSGSKMTIVFTSNLSQKGLENLIKERGDVNVDSKVYSHYIDNVVSVTDSSQADGSDSADWGQAKATVTTSKANLIKKTYAKQDVDASGNPLQVWRIFVNQSFMDLDKGTVITDILPEGLEFVSATAYLYTGKNGSYTKPSNFSNNYAKSDNMITTNSNDPNAVTFTLTENINVPMVIEVRTKLGSGFTGTTLTNKATIDVMDSTFTASAKTEEMPTSHLYKTGGEFDLATRTVRWDIYVGGLTDKATLLDTLKDQTPIVSDSTLIAEFQVEKYTYIMFQRLSNPSVADVKANGAIAEGGPLYWGRSDGTVSFSYGGDESVAFNVLYDNDNNLKIKITPNNAADHVYQISFYTRVSDGIIYGNSAATPTPENMVQNVKATITNTATLTIGDETYEQSATQSVDKQNFIKAGGSDGSGKNYNWEDRTVFWTISANEQRLPYQAGTFQIIDQLPDGLKFVKDRVTVTSGGKTLTELGYTVDCAYNENLTRLTISILNSSGDDEPFRLPVKVNLLTHVTDDGVGLIFGLDAKGNYKGSHVFTNKAYQGGTDLSGTMRWYGDWQDMELKGVPVDKSAAYQEDSANILWNVHVNPKHMAVITPDQRQEIVDVMSVTNLPDGLTAQDLVDFDHATITLSRIPQAGYDKNNPKDGTPEPMALTRIQPGDTPPDTGSYYSFDPEKLTLTMSIDTASHMVNDKYTITYHTPLSVPNNYEGNGSITVGNSVTWSGHEKTATSGSISLASVKASLDTMRYTVLTVHKKDAADNKPLSGAAFDLYRLETDGTRTPVNSGVTKADGSLVFNRLVKGASYVLVETAAPEGYAISAQAGAGIQIDIPTEGNFIEKTVTNQRINSSVQITKIDAETKAPLAGVEFTLYAAGAEKAFVQNGLTNPARTGDNGIVTFDKLPVGNYVVRETGGLPGYVVEAKELTVEITSPSEAIQKTVTNQRILGGIQITKIEEGSLERKLEGAEFTLYQKGVDAPYQGLTNPATTGPDGVATFANLPVGSYVVRETKAPDGYQLGQTPWEQEVLVETHDQIYTYTVKNQPVLGKLIVTKMGEAAQGAVLLPGAKFELLADDRTTVVAGEQETNDRGQITFDGLRLGTYYLRETAAPDGYVLSTELHEVQITADKAEVYLNITNVRTPPPVVPVTPVDPGAPPVVDREEREDRDDTPRPVRVVDPTDLTPQEVETLIEEGFVPLSDIPDLTPEMIIDQQIPLAEFPEEEIPLAVQPGIPVTGDGTPVLLMSVTLLASVAGLLALNWKPRRKK